MRVTINGILTEFPETQLSVAEILRRKRYSFPNIISRINGALVSREEREGALARDGDDVELYHMMSGG
jgi:thiamine biosynthesis protein ThiS